MAQLRFLVSWIGIAAAAAWPALGAAQTAESSVIGAWPDRTQASPLGLNLSRIRYALPCSLGSFLCSDETRSAALPGHAARSDRWAVEMGYVQLGRLERSGGAARAEGLNVSLVGKVPVGASWGVFGKLGTTWGRTDTTALAAGTSASGNESGLGVSYGAGVSWALSPHATATLGWESYDFRFAGGRDPVRTTSLGLQWRY